jgi:polyhydroxyalkanoate synthesis repressor PhaR
MSEPRVVKKYPNRRLYDTAESRYITLKDVRRLVLEKIDFVVVDKASGDDLTRSILLQVIAEQEEQANPLLSQDFLSQAIRCQGGALQGFMAGHLEHCLKLFASHQQQVRDRVKAVTGADPIEAIGNAAQKNYARLRTVQDEILKTLSVAAAAKNRDSTD